MKFETIFFLTLNLIGLLFLVVACFVQPFLKYYPPVNTNDPNPTIKPNPFNKSNKTLLYLTIGSFLMVILLAILQFIGKSENKFYYLYMFLVNVYLLGLIIYSAVLKNNTYEIDGTVKWNSSPYLIITGFVSILISSGLQIALNIYDEHFLVNSFLNE